MSLYTNARHMGIAVTPATSGKAPSFRPDVQGLRAFAVIAVILAHVTGWPAGGFVGVDVFFVISGFLITGLLLREHDKTGRISFKGFYKRRVKRILPASILVLVVTTLVSVLLLPKTRADTTVIDALWSLLFVGNWRFASTGTDYFQEGTAPSPLQHFWSLAVEEQFYFVWPLLMLTTFWIFARVRVHEAGRMAVGAVMLVLTAGSLAWSVWETAGSPTIAYFSTFSRAWELGVGALIAVAAPLLGRISTPARSTLAWLGLLGLLIAVMVITPESSFPAPWALLPVLSTALIITAGTGGDAKYLWPLTNKFSRYVGDISYSLYLWHWPVAILLVAVVESQSPLFYVYAFILLTALSIASYHFVEDPMRKLGRGRKERLEPQGSKVKTKKVAGLSVLALAALCAGLAVADSAVQGARDVFVEPVGAEGAADRPCIGAEALDPAIECGSGTASAPLSPSIDKMADDTGNSFSCWIPEGVGEPMQSCSYGSDSEDALRLAIVGDSHAASLIPALTAGIHESGWHLDTFVGIGCRWQTIPVGDKSCGDAMQQIQASILGGSYDAVVTTASRTYGGDNQARAIQEHTEAWQPAIDAGIKVIVVADVPEVDVAAMECITRIGYDPRTDDCSTTAEMGFAKPDMLVAAAETLNGVSVIDLNELLCLDGKCPYVIGGTVVYRDTAGHLTATYARTLAPYLEAEVRAATSAL